MQEGKKGACAKEAFRLNLLLHLIPPPNSVAVRQADGRTDNQLVFLVQHYNLFLFLNSEFRCCRSPCYLPLLLLLPSSGGGGGPKTGVMLCMVIRVVRRSFIYLYSHSFMAYCDGTSSP